MIFIFQVSLPDRNKYMEDVAFRMNVLTQSHQPQSGSVFSGAESHATRNLWDTSAPTSDLKQQLWLLKFRNTLHWQRIVADELLRHRNRIPPRRIRDVTPFNPQTAETGPCSFDVYPGPTVRLKTPGALVGTVIILDGEVKPSNFGWGPMTGLSQHGNSNGEDSLYSQQTNSKGFTEPGMSWEVVFR